MKFDSLNAMNIFLTTMRENMHTQGDVLFVTSYVRICAGMCRCMHVATWRKRKEKGVGLGKVSDPQGDTLHFLPCMHQYSI